MATLSVVYLQCTSESQGIVEAILSVMWRPLCMSYYVSTQFLLALPMAQHGMSPKLNDIIPSLVGKEQHAEAGKQKKSQLVQPFWNKLINSANC